MKDCNCIFCKIANGEIPTKALYEDEKFIVILDRGPASRGHALLLPKNHYTSLYELPDDIASQALVLAKKMAIKMTRVLKCDGFNILQNNGAVAGQSVFHFHMHLIPRYLGDEHLKIGWNPGEISEEEIDDLVRLIKE
ncbi:HIT family protein [Anaerosacchariphilus polymeriproducens]|uniref:HIT family protein n=1 Tax=Anaerosacchariphilus polymeriproducens TaxID=1812858 RepID=A0A371B009_9FIRM|nr:HIT family protein [Anaerosacchariphilus polymeriproducens]RDU25082.1 HIT family protein [Anaerosacchariphilus polymeriproducens]